MGLTKQEAKENLQQLIEKYNQELTAGHIDDYNEEATKTSFIQPFLKDVLGWDVANRNEVSPEERVTKGKVDYGLKIDGRIKVFIEAKPFREPLDKHIDQIIRYGYSNNKVPFILLTNFKQFKLFDVTLKPDKRNPNKGLKTDLSLTQYQDQFDKLWILSRDSVLTGKLDELLLEKPAKGEPTLIKSILDDLKKWREKLAKDIYKNNPTLFHSGDLEKDANYLKEITQRILDRIIFMRFCEGRELIIGQPLKEIFEERRDSEDTNAMLFLEVKFKRYNETFDSDLFSPQTWEKDLTINFKILKEIILDTYEPYQFEVIPLEILGNMYEQYLGYTIRLTEYQVKYELKPELKKGNGVYYTPEYIVDYIVKNTVGRQLQELSSNKIDKLRILDPACGSGSFLIKAYDEMLKYHSKRKRERMEEKEEKLKDKLGLQHGNAEPRLTIEEKKEILKRHIYGVDIDEQAIEVTKLSLMLKMLEGEYGLLAGRAILPMLDENIKCGNSLVSGNTLELTKYFGNDWYKVKPFNWNERFKKIMIDEDGFDIVIGNPPWGGDIDDFIKFFENKYPNSTQEHKDTFKIFSERGISLLKNKGIIGFIVPSTLLFQPRMKDIRKFFLRYTLLKIINLGERVFGSGVAPACIFILQKESPSLNSIVNYLDISFAKDNLQREKLLTEMHFEDLKGENFKKHSDYSFVPLFENKGEFIVSLGKVLIIKDAGINYQRIKVGMREKGKSDLSNRLLYEGEQKRKIDKMYFKGEDINRYFNLKETNRWCKPDYKDFLKKNEVVHLNDKTYNLIPKILIRQTADHIIATLDDRGVWFGRSLIAIYSKPNDRHNIKYMLALLNSSYIKKVYQNLVQEKGRVFPQVKLSKVKQLPIRTIDFSNPFEKKFHDDLVALVDVMIDLNKRVQTTSGAEKEQIQTQIEKTDTEIDDLVYKLYDI